jgi:hypothetical protein
MLRRAEGHTTLHSCQNLNTYALEPTALVEISQTLLTGCYTCTRHKKVNVGEEAGNSDVAYPTV